MKKKGSVLLLVLIVIVAWWWLLRGRADAAPEVGVLDVWATWGDEPDGLQAFFDGFSAPGNIPIRVRTRVRSDDLLEALNRGEAPDLVILSNADLVRAYDDQGLVEPLVPWITAAGIDLEAIYPSLLQQCRTAAGEYLCLPWGGDVEALIWNKKLFAAAGLDPERPPQTMEELLTYASRLSRRDEEDNLVEVGFIPDFPRSHLELYALQLGASVERAEGFAANADPIVEALNWQQQFYELYAPGEVDVFVSSLTPYMSSAHSTHGGKKLDCRQCHRSSPIQKRKTPDTIFCEGHVAMMVDGQWQVTQRSATDGAQDNMGIVPFPSPETYPGHANRAVVQGPVLMVPSGAIDKNAVAPLLAWMMSPVRLAAAAYTQGFLPASRVAARDSRFEQTRDLEVFLELIADSEATSLSAMPDRLAYNSALADLENAVLHQEGAARPLVDELQRTFALRREEALGYE